MKRSAKVVLAAVLSSWLGCIDWEDAEQSWCNDAILEGRHAVCGFPDTTIAGVAPGIDAFAGFGGEGFDTVAGMASLPSGTFVGGSFASSVSLGSKLVSAGGADAYLAKLDGEGAFVAATGFGGPGEDAVVDLVAGSADSMFAAVRFQAQISGPGGDTFSTAGQVDSLLLALDGNLQPVASLGFGAETGSRVEVTDLHYAHGRLVVAGTLHGFMNLNGARLGDGGPAAFVAVFDPQLQPLWQAATSGCPDAIGDSAAIGPAGEVFFTFRVNAGPPSSSGCTLLNQPIAPAPGPEDPPPPPWQDVLARIDLDPATGPFIQPWWLLLYNDSVRNPYVVVTSINPTVFSPRPGYEASNQVALTGEELIFLRHTPDSSQNRRPGANVAFLSPDSAQPTRGSQTIGRGASTQGHGQNMRARVQVDREGLVWVYGEFQDGEMLLDNLVNGPFVAARNGFVRVFNNADPSREWARVFVGQSPTVGATVTGVTVDASRRVWVAGTFEGSMVATDEWLDASSADGFLYITEPQP